MARSRSIPTALLEDPDFFEQGSDTQIILIQLVLGADDYGRGSAHTGLLARKFNKAEALIAQAVCELETCGMLLCYQVERHSYYHVTRWDEWETLTRRTPSKYPAPPVHDDTPLLEDAGKPMKLLEAPGDSRKRLSEGEGEEKRREVEERREVEVEVEVEEPPPNVVAFPTTRADSDAAFLAHNASVEETTKQVARILKLSETAALARIVAEYWQLPQLSLLGEADAAREWIEDRRRNRQGQRMTPAFFRRWLKREQEAVAQRQAARAQTPATGTTDGRVRTTAPPRTPPPQENEDAYQVFLQRRVQEVQAQYGDPGAGGTS